MLEGTTELALEKPLVPEEKTVRSLRLLLLSGLAALGMAALMSVSVWFVKRESQNAFNLRSAQLTQWLQSNAQSALDQHLEGLVQLSGLCGSVPPAELPDQFKGGAAEALRKNPAFSAFNYVNNDFVVEDVYPPAINRSALRLDLKSRFDVLPVAHRALSQRQTAATDLVDLVQGGRGVLFYTPIVRGDRWGGFVEGVMKLEDFNAVFLEKDLGADHHYTLIDETSGREVFTSFSRRAQERSTPYDTYFTLKLADRTWWVVLHPKSPPLVLLPLVSLLLIELCLGGVGLYLLWRRELPPFFS